MVYVSPSEKTCVSCLRGARHLCDLHAEHGGDSDL